MMEYPLAGLTMRNPDDALAAGQRPRRKHRRAADTAPAMNYAELQVTSNFTFLEGASHPEELVAQAAALGHSAIAITDRNSLAGVVRAHLAAKQAGLRLVPGARLELTDAPSLLCFPTDRAAYGRLSQLITLGRRRAEKGACHLAFADVVADVVTDGEGCLFIALPPADLNNDFLGYLKKLRRVFEDRCYLAAQYLYRGDDVARLAQLAALAAAAGLPLIAGNDVHYHVPQRRPLMDVLTCIREHCTIDAAGGRLAANAERHLKPPEEMARLFGAYPGAVAATARLVARCSFSLDELRYDYAADPVPEGLSPDDYLARLSWAGAATRYPGGVPDKVRAQIEHELDLVAQLGYAPYFLTVHDIVRFARERDILCQGRGSAANSAVCYCLGITAVDPARLDLLFERFISAERNEPPDIDVDFEHERREEVIQYIYEKYGRERAGLTATVISYRARSAVREVGKAMGLSEDLVGALAGQVWGWSKSEGPDETAIRELGLDPADRRLAQTMALTRELMGFPRHLSQHVGGFVIAAGRLDALVPIENAAMEDRTVIQWDKDDLDAMGILKIDVLGLGMLTCVRKGFDLLARHHGRRLDLATVPAEDEAVYDMLCQGDSLGVFQVESRAQMAFLPRMKPRNFYDLVIEVAIVRPGPIQGDMVHPYLRRRNGEERVSFPSKELEEVLGKTLGVPLFQEQAMKISIVAAGFTPGEADGLRRAMATFRRTGTIHSFRAKMIGGMVARGYESDFAERCFRQIEGFGEYGFPESHAASFALLVYVSAWMKCHYPDVFACALLNSQPMGFYAPAQIVRDAAEHGVEIRAPDINHSDWDCTLEEDGKGANGNGYCALRLGLRQVKGLRQDDGEAIAAARAQMPDQAFAGIETLWRRAGTGLAALEVLARADGFRSLGLDRRGAIWAVKGLGGAGNAKPLPLMAAAVRQEDKNQEDRQEDKNNKAQHSFLPLMEQRPAALPHEVPGEAVANDYAALRLSLKDHPMGLLRPEMARRGVLANDGLRHAVPDRRVTVAGLVLVRQRPGSAKGVIFMTLEDETGTANVIVWPDAFERFRKIVLASRLVLVRGRLQRQGIVTHVIAHEIENLSHLLDRLAGGSDHAMPRRLKRGQGRKARLPVVSRDFH